MSIFVCTVKLLLMNFHFWYLVDTSQHECFTVFRDNVIVCIDCIGPNNFPAIFFTCYIIWCTVCFCARYNIFVLTFFLNWICSDRYSCHGNQKITTNISINRHSIISIIFSMILLSLFALHLQWPMANKHT